MHIGDIVLCKSTTKKEHLKGFVRDGDYRSFNGPLPEEGRKYRIRGFRKDVDGIYIVGISLPKDFTNIEVALYKEDFLILPEDNLRNQFVREANELISFMNTVCGTTRALDANLLTLSDCYNVMFKFSKDVYDGKFLFYNTKIGAVYNDRSFTTVQELIKHCLRFNVKIVYDGRVVIDKSNWTSYEYTV